ncbi:PEST proteolytic signal-containing nuclear protein [Echinococcus granulosus]|uniref:PEST proteolytic signal-containing nuclear protein n=1 Tax=Echinococcus granulosus TaxID=6210 RepID=A0A068WMQ1_ECHGR|nr:PEST proteolytic signal-containing nuclear protein [Echinococcus granulosus]CDS21388.1 PEST proteolytic signal containing nuclear [Echinococcus granulosus]
MNKSKSPEKVVSLSLKRKHSEAEPQTRESSVSLSSIPVPPSVPKKTKPCLPIKRISLSLPNKSLSDGAKKENFKLQPLSGDVAKVFGQDEESEEEEMPMEARIRMRNKGRETPTSSGPNSFGKSRYGFIDRRALLNKQLEALNERVSGDNEDRSTSTVWKVEALCGFGKVVYPDRYLHFPTTKVAVPPHTDIGTRWVTPEGHFDCTVFGVDSLRPYVLEVSCCLIKSTDLEPWGEIKKGRLLSGIHEIFMEAGLT